MQNEPQPRRSGWTDERRARQAEAIRRWAPWTKSTGPKSAAGKAVSARNATLTGARAQVAAIKVQAATDLRELAETMREMRRIEADGRRRARSRSASVKQGEASSGLDAAARYFAALRA
jgi:hypothetical protein